MAKGDRIQNEFYEYRDADTGKRVVRLTTPDHVNHHEYFYYKMVTNDNRNLIYASERNGERQLYQMDLRDGSAVQLTEGAGTSDFGAFLSPDDQYLFYSQNGRFFRMERASLQSELYYEVPQGWLGSDPSLRADGKSLVMTQMDGRDQIKAAGNWDFFEPQWATKPHCRMVVVDIENKTDKVVYDTRCWLGHAQFRPGPTNEDILFCHEGPWNRIDARLWLMKSDGSGVRCARPQHNEVVTHEFWLNDGSRFAFVRADRVGGEAETIRLINPDTLEEEILMECSGLKHFITNADDSLIVGDGELPGKPFIYLVDLRKKEERPLCRHDTRWKNYGNNQDAHAHPAFSPDGSFVIFTSDREGLPCIYQCFLDA